MSGITDSERGIDAGTRLIDRGSSLPKPAEPVDAGVPLSRYWTPETKPHRVVFPSRFYDAQFDFNPNPGNPASGVAVGQGFAGPHKGTYTIISNTPESFRMRVTIGTNENPKKDMNATLTIGKNGAMVSGTVNGQQTSTPTPLRVSGNGTEKAPFRVEFPEQVLEWY